MSSFDSLRVAAVDRMAAQWIALGSPLTGVPDGTVIDLEALVVVTAALGDRDARVREAAVEWCAEFGGSLSAGRLQSVAAEMGVDEDALGSLAATIAAAGGPRWPFATTPWPHRRHGGIVVHDLAAPSRLAWRLRAAFGANARAETLTSMLTMPRSDTASIADLAQRTRFTKRNVALVVRSLALAGILEVERRRNEDRVRMAVASPFWAWWEQLDGVPGIDWVSRWRVVLATLAVLAATATSSLAVRAVEGRTLVEAVHDEILAAGLPRPDQTAYGLAFADAFDAWTESITLVLHSPGA
jgi:hypothetical protein